MGDGSNAGAGNDLGSLPNTTVSDRECPDCDGTVWDHEDEDVCGNCSIIVGSKRREYTDVWEHFFENRSDHWNSDKPRCVGGFPWAYDWIDDDDVNEQETNI